MRPPGKIALVVQAFPEISETFIVNKFRGLRERGLDVHVLSSRSEAASWSKFPALLRDEELRSRVHISWPLRPAWLGGFLLPIVLLRDAVDFQRA